MEKAYNPKDCEEEILKKWQDEKVFTAINPNDSQTGKSFTVPIPPPNVTGQLHLGHAMMLVIQDIMSRYHRMKGDATLWLPGTDHAAIATESVVLKNLGVASREVFSRPEFLEKCRTHTDKTHKTITNQIKRMGASCDFTRERFTMDLGMSNAVQKIFTDLYKAGLIVRGHRMVNWSTGAQSVLADDEVEWEDRKEPFYSIRCGRFVIGTVRPETKCAHSPIVLHPDENYVLARFTDSAGKSEELIFSEVLFYDEERRNKVFNLLDENGKWELVSVHQGKEFEGQKFEAETYAGMRIFFVLCDAQVIDIKKGTGAMTISANHSADDYDLAKRRNLDEYFIEKIGFDGKMKSIAGVLEGETVQEARWKAGKTMKEKGLLVGKDTSYVHNVPLCYRSGCVVEPMISPQWFIAVEKEFLWQEGVGRIRNEELEMKNKGEKTTLKKLMQDAVREKQVKIIPERFEKTYFQWIDNLRDWCISRQIWWGHQIPIWYDEQGKEYTAHEQTLLFSRHGESEAEPSNILQKNPLLTKKGETQAKELGEKLLQEGRRIAKIICSPLERSKKTAEICRDALTPSNSPTPLNPPFSGGKSGGEIPIEIWEDFDEIRFGDLEGTVRATETGKTTMERMMNEPTAESLEDLHSRALKIWEKISALPPEDGEILFIGHRAFTGILFAVRDGVKPEHFIDVRKRWEMGNCTVKEITWMVKPKKDSFLRQDEDTLDTWFSSALWPFSTLGWPDTKNPDFQNFFPTSVLETGHDILFFWVARMIMFSLFATGKNPFETVYLHGLVCDEEGKKMSKSKGNGIDPLDMIEKYGTDALRMAMVVGTTPGNQVNLGEKKIEGYRNFANKLWNVARYILALPLHPDYKPLTNGNAELLTERWILSKTQRLIQEVHKGLENHQYGEVGQKLYDFTWNDLADWAIEASKTETQLAHPLQEVLKTLLKLLHPYIPFVTEKIWEVMPLSTGGHDTLLLALTAFPEYDEALIDEKAEYDFGLLQEVITKIRSLRAATKVEPAKKIKAIFTGSNIEILQKNELILKNLARLEEVLYGEIPTEKCVTDMISGTEIYLPLSEMVNMEDEKGRLKKELLEAEKLLQNLDSRLSNEQYITSAPPHLVAETRAKKEEVEKKIETLKILF
ncbi:MAG: class I tRNA ligase family protein [Candidatus Peregrinibacteria bacterium]